MKKVLIFLAFILALSGFAEIVDAHGRLMVPPARSSAWREDPLRFVPDYGDNQMFCGGIDVQYRINNGKCGICGEPYDLPKDYEKGGKLYRGFSVRTYTEGQWIQSKIEITANHYGWFEFRICNTDKLNGAEATQECLDQNLLKNNKGKTRHFLETAKTGFFFVTLKLPAGLNCKHCVFQWKYHSGNSWGYDKMTNRGCLGCGNQEEFYGCSDITIKPLSSKRVWDGTKNDDDDHPEKKGLDTVETDEQTMISKRLLQQLIDELKRMRAGSMHKKELEGIPYDLEDMAERNVAMSRVETETSDMSKRDGIIEPESDSEQTKRELDSSSFKEVKYSNPRDN